MARMAAGRTTQLSADEIARELVRLFDESDGEPSIRALASALHVSPRAIYHYFDTRQELVAAALDLVWEEAIAHIVEQIADPVHDIGDPVEFFVVVALATRRAFARHRRLALHVGVAGGPNSRLAGAIAIIGSALEQVGLTGDDAGRAVYAYTTFVLGSVMLDASRWSAEQGSHLPLAGFSSRDLMPADAPEVEDATIDAIDGVLAGSQGDASANDERFAAGVRALLRGFIDAAG